MVIASGGPTAATPLPGTRLCSRRFGLAMGRSDRVWSTKRLRCTDQRAFTRYPAVDGEHLSGALGHRPRSPDAGRTVLVEGRRLHSHRDRSRMLSGPASTRGAQSRPATPSDTPTPGEPPSSAISIYERPKRLRACGAGRTAASRIRRSRRYRSASPIHAPRTSAGDACFPATSRRARARRR